MHRLKQLLATVFGVTAIVAAVALYAIKQETRVVAVEVAHLEDLIATQSSQIVLLKAELAHRARPDRIAKAARAHLGMRPIAPAQLGTVDGLPWREGAVAEGTTASKSP
jgi:cell division protein FtsL